MKILEESMNIILFHRWFESNMIELRRPMSVATWTYQMVKHGKTNHKTWYARIYTTNLRTLQHDPRRFWLSQSWMANTLAIISATDTILVTPDDLCSISQKNDLHVRISQWLIYWFHHPQKPCGPRSYDIFPQKLRDNMPFFPQKTSSSIASSVPGPGPRLFRFAFRHPGLVGVNSVNHPKHFAKQQEFHGNKFQPRPPLNNPWTMVPVCLNMSTTAWFLGGDGILLL